MIPSVFRFYSSLGTTSRRRAGVAGALVASLALLLAHALHYWFLTDDAFITFRYSENLASGYGLVFNEGERVEGYSNFLWAIILASFSFLGLAPHSVANVLSLGATVALWVVVVLAARASLHNHESRLWIVLPCFFLALTRSFAVWSTGGLETRLFELLVIGGCAGLVQSIRAERQGRASSFVLPAVLLALAALTRPDGLLITGMTGATGMVILWRYRVLGRRHLRAALLCAGIICAHLSFRLLYYGEWLPNTYYAKVGGRVQWDLGLQYLEAFCAEYWLVLWLAPVAAAVWSHTRQGSGYCVAIAGAAVLPHALFFISVGGDHFEYRPFDLYFPFLFLLATDGLRFIFDRPIESSSLGRFTRTAVGYSLISLLALGLVARPWQLHREFPRAYVGGFPGWTNVPRADWGHASNNPLSFVPGLMLGQDALQTLLWNLTKKSVGLRQEEHAAFSKLVVSEGLLLRRAIESGILRPDTHVAIDCVGAIPYFSRMRVLDRLGLTDRSVARSPFVSELMGHGKRASLEYAASRGVDFWATSPVHLVFPLESPTLRQNIARCQALAIPCYAARISSTHVILVRSLKNHEHIVKRFNNLQLTSVHDAPALKATLGLGQE